MQSLNQTHLSRLDASTSYTDERAMVGETAVCKLENIELSIAGDHLLAVLDAEIDMEHDGTGWTMTGVSYWNYPLVSGEKPGFDVQKLRERERDETLTHHVERAVLKALEKEYNHLCNQADDEVRARNER